MDYGQPTAFTTATRLGFDGGRYVYIPDEVARHLPEPPAATQPLQPPIGQVLSRLGPHLPARPLPDMGITRGRPFR